MPQSAMEQFREACGLSGPLTLESRDRGRPSGQRVSYRLDGPFALIGRDPLADLILPSAEVSRRHAFVQVVAGGLFCIDLESRTRLRWLGETEPRVHGWLDPGCELEIGPYAVRWDGPDSHSHTSPAPPGPLASGMPEETPSSLLPRAGLEVPIQVGNQQSVWSMDSQVTLVGRSESCQVVLRDVSVSRFHASLIRTSEGVWIVDLLAREGVSVNGVKVRWAWLDEGDKVKIGHFHFVLHYDQAPGKITRSDVPLEAGAVAKAANGVGSSRTQAKGRSLAIRSTNGSRSMLAISPPSRHRPTPAIIEPEASAWEPAVQVSAEQFGMWRQQMQMMESFHNDMILMVQMFMAMHREHQVSVRDELDRVQKLTRELADLQAKLAETAKQTEADRLPDKGRSAHGRGSANGAATARPELNHTSPDSPGDRKHRRGPAPAAKSGLTAPGRIDSGEERAESPSQHRPLPADCMGFHSHLTQRITELQRQRQGYWQKVLSAINR